MTSTFILVLWIASAQRASIDTLPVRYFSEKSCEDAGDRFVASIGKSGLTGTYYGFACVPRD